MKNRYLLLLLPSTTSLALICEHPEINNEVQTNLNILKYLNIEIFEYWIFEHPEIKKVQTNLGRDRFCFHRGSRLGWSGRLQELGHYICKCIIFISHGNYICKCIIFVSFGNYIWKCIIFIHMEFISGNASFLFHIEIISGKASFFCLLLNIIKVANFDKSFVTVYCMIFHYI